MTTAQVREFFSTTYYKFTRLYSALRVEEDEPQLRVPEKTIRCIWNDQLFKTGDLTTTDNESLKVVYPGHWNFGSGPDFTHAIIEVDGKAYEGDVELHVYSTDWKAHRHAENKEYDRVVLHVFMWKGRGAKASLRQPPVRAAGPSGKHIYELELKSFLKKGVIELTHELDFDAYPVFNKINLGRCHKPLADLSEEKLAHLLSSAGDARILTKMNRFHDRVIANGYEQTVYEGVAEALGYPVNKEPFRALAESLPLSRIRELVPPDLKNKEKIMRLQALLFGMSGLIEFKNLDRDALPADEKKYFSRLDKIWSQYKTQCPPQTLRPEHWKFGGMRPANYPYRRIAALGRLVARHDAEGIFADFLKALGSCQAEDKELERKQARNLHEFFCLKAEDDYWAGHYTAGGKPLARAQQLVGPERSQAVVVNILIPIGLIYAQASKSQALEGTLDQLFVFAKRFPDNKSTRFMKHYILGNRKELLDLLVGEKEAQGLMQVYQDYCTQNDNNCNRCRFPEIVKKYFD